MYTTEIGNVGEVGVLSLALYQNTRCEEGCPCACHTITLVSHSCVRRRGGEEDYEVVVPFSWEQRSSKRK